MKKGIIKGAFAIEKNPIPWKRAISAGICASLPIIIGILLGNFQYGLIAGIGGFSYLYVFNEPYPHRAKKVFFILLGLSASIGLGTLTAPSPFIFAILMGVIGAVSTFIFGALKISGPASIFFVVVFAITSAMTIDPALAPLRSVLVFLGGTISWIVAMIGWIYNPHGPETRAIKRVYLELAVCLNSVGTEQFSESRNRTLSALKEADEALAAGYVTGRNIKFKQLYVLKEKALMIWSDVLEVAAQGRVELPSELVEYSKIIAISLDQSKSSKGFTDRTVEQLFSKLDEAEGSKNQLSSEINQDIHITKPTLKKTFLAAFDKNSIVFLSSLKYGLVLSIAAIIAFAFEFDRSYWIPVSCGAVMLGATIMSTFHRAIQRSIGTVTGILLAIMILSIQPSALMVALFIALLHFFTETFMVRNYAIAVTFITPNALLIAENTTQIQNISYFASARIIDILIGSVIGFIGVLLIGKQFASRRLLHIMAKTIRSQSQLFHLLFADQTREFIFVESREQNKMRTNLEDLRKVYSTALGEKITNKQKGVEYLSPIILSIEHLGYLLDSISKTDKRPVLNDEILAQFLLVFETMAKASEQHELAVSKNIPMIEGYSKIQKEIISLQDSFQLVQGHTNNNCASK